MRFTLIIFALYILDEIGISIPSFLGFIVVSFLLAVIYTRISK